MKKNIIVSYSPDEDAKMLFPEILGDLGHIDFLPEKDDSDRIRLLAGADVVVALSFAEQEIHESEISHLRNLRFIQLVYAGADHIPFSLIPKNILMASNVGAFAEPIAEHVLGLVLALAKNLLPNYKKLAAGRFDRDCYNQELKGAVSIAAGQPMHLSSLSVKLQSLEKRWKFRTWWSSPLL